MNKLRTAEVTEGNTLSGDQDDILQTVNFEVCHLGPNNRTCGLIFYDQVSQENGGGIAVIKLLCVLRISSSIL